VHKGFWWEDLKEGNHMEDPGVDGGIILKWASRSRMWAWTGLLLLKIGGGLL